eukprot:6467926-Amphidinium_carterae.1
MSIVFGFPCSMSPSLTPFGGPAVRCTPTVLTYRLLRAIAEKLWHSAKQHTVCTHEEKMKAKVSKIVSHGCNVFINRQLIYNYPDQLFKAGLVRNATPQCAFDRPEVSSASSIIPERLRAVFCTNVASAEMHLLVRMASQQLNAAAVR